MDKILFRRVQLAQLCILEELDHICTEHNLTYYIVGGTLLGAVRHKGFIPWDVDIDVVMPRNDYELLDVLYTKESKSKFTLLNYKNTRNYTRPHALLCLRETKLYNKYSKYNPNLPNYGIYMDIFPLDNTPDELALRKKHEKEINFWKRLQNNKISCSYTDNIIKQFAHHVIRAAHKPLSLDWINERFDKCISRYKDRNTSEIGAVGGGRFPYSKESMKREVFGKPVKLLFEGKYFNAPERYDEWLKCMYGDYMKLPPIQQQEEGYSYIESVQF